MHPVRRVIRKWFRPDKALGWVGVKWFRKSNADELIGHLWEEGWYIVRVHDLKPGVADRYAEKGC